MTEFFIKTILTEELFGNRICESQEDYQIVNYLYDKLLLEKFLYGEPVTVPELRKLLHKKILNFEFIKLDGEVRPAKGTTMMKYIPKKDHPKGVRPSSPKVATFFDLDKDAWRSVSKKSKEIVIKKDKKKGKPVVVVKDKDDKEKLGPEPIDDLKVGDIRNYLEDDENIVIEIIKMDDDGTVHAKEVKNDRPLTIHPDEVKNIGEETEPEKEEPEKEEPEKEEPEKEEPEKEEPEKKPEKKPKEKPKKKPKKKPEPKIEPKVEEPEETTILIPKEESPEEEAESKEKPKEIESEEPPEEEIGDEGPEEEEIE